MLTGKESTDELLAHWADLLRSRAGITSASQLQYVVRYDTREYFCEDDFQIMNAIHALFLKDIDACIAHVEAELANLGVTVTRPSPTD